MDYYTAIYPYAYNVQAILLFLVIKISFLIVPDVAVLGKYFLDMELVVSLLFCNKQFLVLGDINIY